LLGPLVHNNIVNQELLDNGFQMLKNKNEIENFQNVTFISTAHGINPNLIEQIKKNNNTLIETTCPIVLKNNNKIIDYAKKGYECKHNIKYWQAEEYIGLGCAAHSYFNGARYNNTINLDDYINQKDIIQNKEILTNTDMQEEFILLGLRMNRGIDLTEYKKRFNLDFIFEYKETIQKLKNLNLIDFNERYLYLTEKGMDILDSVVLEFIKEI
jgi:coproporphyrinogen III oxidase-like Fe-S oxidoreductase